MKSALNYVMTGEVVYYRYTNMLQ